MWPAIVCDGDEVTLRIEAVRVLILRVNDDAYAAAYRCRISDSTERVDQERFAEALAADRQRSGRRAEANAPH